MNGTMKYKGYQGSVEFSKEDGVFSCLGVGYSLTCFIRRARHGKP